MGYEKEENKHGFTPKRTIKWGWIAGILLAIAIVLSSMLSQLSKDKTLTTYVSEDTSSTEPATNLNIGVDKEQQFIVDSLEIVNISTEIQHYTMYTHTIWDNITNDVSTIRTWIEDPIQIIQHLRELYPPNTEFKVLYSQGAEFTINTETTDIVKH